MACYFLLMLVRHGADSSEEKRVAKSQPEDSSSEGEEAEIAVAGNDSAFKTPPRVCSLSLYCIFVCSTLKPFLALAHY